jgi:hypothetical protein
MQGYFIPIDIRKQYPNSSLYSWGGELTRNAENEIAMPFGVRNLQKRRENEITLRKMG